MKTIEGIKWQFLRRNPNATLRKLTSHFVDTKWVRFRGGQGGNGCITMTRLWCNEFAGPGGGDGGNGAHVVLKADGKVKSLNHIASFYQGEPGVGGRSKNMFGANAKHKFINVPLGCMVCKPHFNRDLPDDQYDPEESEVVAELDVEDSMFIAARGGAGGRGNTYYLSNTNRHPRVAQAGAHGEENEYELRIRVYAHFGLIGLPNAGKSSLLRALTDANVKIAEYPFTTLHPQVGVVKYDEQDFSQVAISDLPGLIEESSKNRGLGVRFLRHAQRCACLLYVIDVSSDPIREMEILSQEMEVFRKGMSRRAHMIVGNKLDRLGRPSDGDKMEKFRTYLAKKWPDSRLILISATRGDNLEELRTAIGRMYGEYRREADDGIERGLTW